MLSAPSRPRPIGLPSSPRPQKTAYSAHSSPSNVLSELPPASPAHSRSEHLTSSLHARSHSQPPRTRRPLIHDRSTPNENLYDVRSYRDSASYEDDQSQPPSSVRVRVRDGEPPQVPSSRGNILPLQDRAPESSYPRPATRRATIDESSGDGYAIWNAVTNVASALTISVSKAWSTNITTFSGEETPPGQESRLTRAMKAYHIAKAQDASDLPGWLFDEGERWAANIRAQPNNIIDDQTQASPPQNSIRSNTAPGERWTSSSAPHESTPSQSRLRGTDRLKAMRDTRRGAGEQTSFGNVRSDNRKHFADSSVDVPQSTTKQPRVGLPSRPQRGRR